MQQEMAKADPETRRQIKNVLAMMAEGKELSQPKNLPLPLRSQLVPKGAP
jgi:hypothetical protein